MIELRHLQAELSGLNLIEASAGTGKTYAIALLYLRLLVELGLEPKQILVVTFTEAATKELRGRIRRRIREALEVMDGAETADPLLRDLCANANGRWEDRQLCRASLERALTSFDTAAIFTIHGFCLRTLQDNAFESGSLFDTELVTDPTDLVRQVVEDFWRRSFFTDSAHLLVSALSNNVTVAALETFALGMTAHPGVQIIPQCSPELIAGLDADCRALFGRIGQEWRPEIRDLLTNDKGLSRSADHYKESELPGWCAALAGYLSGHNPYDLPPGFVMFTASRIAKGKKPTGAPLSHPFFYICEELYQKVHQRLLLFRGELLDYCNRQIPERKKQRNIRFFSDLLTELHGALCGSDGAALAARLRETYRAALIDEFQDTDPVQYDIFRSIQGNTGLPLFLIGDPKQAIYSFRGADIFAYMQAAREVQEEHRFTLTSNWRSTPELLTAFNRVFANDRKPFIYDQIGYHPVTAGKDADLRLSDPSGATAPLQFMLISPDTINVTGAHDLIPRAVATEIVRLLGEGSRIGAEPVAPADIAVIVRSHRQAAAIRDVLVPLGIPCVMRSDLTIFATDEAREVCTLLQGVLNPGKESTVRAALVTDILGKNGSDIAAFLEDEASWERCLEQFREYHRLWEERGFMVMTRHLLEEQGVLGRLLRYPDGERRLTNLLHCFEVIHGKAHEGGMAQEGLTTWFSQRVSAGEKKEEHEIRLETDEKAVKIQTIHVSKGLEYPIVFSPYLWTGLIGNNEVAAFHEGAAMIKDYGSDDFALHRQRAEKEQLAESLRLLYVAVTRARYRCYLYGGKITSSSDKSRPDTSPLAYLFHASPTTRSAEDLVACLESNYAALSATKLREHLEECAAGSDGAMAVAQLPDDPTPGEWRLPREQTGGYVYRSFGGTLRNDWRVASFTSFAGHESKTAELPDRDGSLHGEPSREPAVDTVDGRTIFTFPRGAKAGIFMHAIFEQLDFSAAAQPAITGLVAKQLDAHGFDAGWLPCISAMVADVVSTPLATPDGEFRLSDLAPGSWLPELEFFFPLKFITSDKLRRLLADYAPDFQPSDLDALQFRPVRGLVRGFMDLVFRHRGRYYLLDWKSNHLGYRREEYHQDALRREMGRNLYGLQYLLYTVALNRYLSLRVTNYRYETDFGGVFYLFLRGMNPRGGDDSGVFSAGPPAELVARLTGLLLETDVEQTP